MVEITAIAGALNSLKIALDLTKGAISARDAKLISDSLEQIRARLIETQMLVLEAHATIAALLDSERELKGKLADCEKRLAEREQYNLVRLSGGALAYRAEPAPGRDSPAHHACPTCFHQAQISILQPRQWEYGLPSLDCPVCKLSITAGEPEQGK